MHALNVRDVPEPLLRKAKALASWQGLTLREFTLRALAREADRVDAEREADEYKMQLRQAAVDAVSRRLDAGK